MIVSMGLYTIIDNDCEYGVIDNDCEYGVIHNNYRQWLWVWGYTPSSTMIVSMGLYTIIIDNDCEYGVIHHHRQWLWVWGYTQ